MNWAEGSILVSLVFIASLAEAASQQVSVNCNSGQSLNSTLSKLDKLTPTTVSVTGTCTEYVQVIGFENLTLKGLSGATVVQPLSSTGMPPTDTLLIESSRSITVDGLNIQAATVSGTGIAIGRGSSDIRLRNLTVQGGGEGIIVFERSQVSVANVSAQDPGYATLGMYDLSDVHVEHCSFKDSTGDAWHVGIDMGASHVSIYATTINNMQVGINAYSNSAVDVGTFTNYFAITGVTDVNISSPAGTNYNGVQLDRGSELGVSTAKLVITNPGQTWGGTTGGILVSDGSSMTASSGELLIAGSHGQGVVALNNSHATLTGASITGGAHGGVVATNLSTVDVATGTALTLVGGNAVDLFCDPGSAITGSANLSGAPTAQCTNLMSGETVTLP